MSEINARPFDYFSAGYAEKLKTSKVSGAKVDLDEDPNKKQESFEDILNKALTAALQPESDDTKVAPAADVSSAQAISSGASAPTSAPTQTQVAVADSKRSDKAIDSVVANKISPHQWGAQG